MLALHFETYSDHSKMRFGTAVHDLLRAFQIEFKRCMLAMQVFGRTFTLAGYPPWSIRFSEIYHMGELTDFTRRKLTDALQRYCKTPQRFGT